jgi:hypothetical protein
MSELDTVDKVTAGALSVALSAWLLITATNQHPNRAFDWARKYDKSGIGIPNWRFFAPNPAIHDNRVAHRALLADGTTTEWTDTRLIPARSWWNAVWFPHRRRDKGITDMVGTITECLIGRTVPPELTTAYRCLSSLVREEVGRQFPADDIVGYQFVIGSDAGYDDSEPPEVMFASRFEPWSKGAVNVS